MSISKIPFISSILHPTDFSAASEKAFAHALAIALFRQTKFTILNVGRHRGVESRWQQFPAVRETLERWDLLEENSPRSAVFEKLGVSIEKAATSAISTTSSILDYVSSNPVDLVVLATEGREGLSRWLKRSKAEAVSRASNALTLFVPSQGKGFVQVENGGISFKRILIPIDHQPSPTAAIIFATRAAQTFGVAETVEIVLLHVGSDKAVLDLDLDLPENAAWGFRKEVRQGDTIEEIITAANQFSADVIIMVTAGREGIFDVLYGSTTEQVLRKAPCPLLAVPQSWSK